MTFLLAILGAGVGGGLLLIGTGLRPGARRPRLTRAERGCPPRAIPIARLGVVGVVGLVVGVATGWPVAAVLAGVAAWTLPAVLGPDRAGRRQVGRMEAVASWAEDLTGTLRAGAGIEQAVITTAVIGPPQLRAELDQLAHSLRSGVRLPQALRSFADEVADPTADLVVNVLLQAAEHQARDIAAGLTAVGQIARDQVSARLRIATKRAATHTSTRIVITVVLATTVLLSVATADFLRPYGTFVGQLVLAVLGAAFSGCLVWMVRVGRVKDLPRILTAAPGVEAGTR
ncbi:hypothetical protein Lfu02_75870 [Longispora fulva]|uniref:Flp pilus assembly protein TadB n=1 Tax=Longispora fulva TaxID=619741 RepID=A0A8J7GSK6_9ACTN|nr:type II secretion system F family protein [Longispora fulva]MBG6136276.1 Flp pilus assembly protein TadB [Longispora fulva]GIG63215.1 hypothetical protein Lfu02_75870 [Longispora fulva]